MPKTNEAPPAAGPKLVTMSIRVTEELAERVRNAIFWTPGATLVSVGQAAVEKELERLERANGGKFKPRTQQGLTRGPRPR